ncbi:MFS transporter [Pectinatus brassicae]|uniref:MFS family permease n=1 Tax=Pectinatus brassicae TaxID=862415 RepID=A0A840UE25_9FIRM|nr:MFS transporter [Pectinatus brassicae]MBB5335279.1 MFS family permease [Pectinatus brassicae]
MTKESLWTKNFITLIGTNAFLFAGFHCLLPTLPLYAASLGATGSQIGIVTGIFGFAAIIVRLFTDTGVRALGKKKCLYIGLFLSIIATVSYRVFTSIDMLIIARIIHGFGFGLSTTFAAAIVSDVIPDSRRGEGIGYFGLGSTVAMALSPALGVMLLSDYSSVALFAFSAIATVLSVLCTKACSAKEIIPELPTSAMHTSIKNRIYESGTGIPAILTILFGAAYGSVNTFIAMMAKQAGIADAGIFFIVGTIFVFISRPFGGRLFDSKGAFWVILPGAFLFLGALFIIINASTLPILLAASVLYGLGGGLLLPALLTWMLNVVHADRRSSASATFYNMLDIGTSGGIIILGSLAGSVGYIHMYVYVIDAMIAFIAFFILQHFLKTQKKTYVPDKTND